MSRAEDVAAVTAQLGRAPRGGWQVAHRCPCGAPAVLANPPRLPDATPFPTHYYLTCVRATQAIGRLEARGLMRRWQEELADDPDLADRYAQAHRAYLRARAAFAGPGEVPDHLADVSAGGMPSRVKCLHALAAHSLAAGPGVNPLGDRVVGMLGCYWTSPCWSRPAGRTEQ